MSRKFKRQNRSFLKMAGLVLVLLLALSALAAMAAASAAPIPTRIPLKAAAAAELPPTPCTDDGAGTVTCNFWAETGTDALTLADGTLVDIWGYATSDGGTPTLPGPVIIATEGDTVVVNLVNNLAEKTSMVFPGQDMVPDLIGAPANGGSQEYSFTATYPGTFIYEAGLLPGVQHQVPMGMYGAMVVRPDLPASAAPDYGDAIIPDGPVYYYRLGEAVYTDPAVDEIGSSNGSYGSTVALGQTGLPASSSDTAAGFNGATSDFVDTNVTSLNSGGAFSVEAWVNANDTTGPIRILAKDEVGIKGEWILRFNNGDLIFQVYNPNTDWVVVTAPTPPAPGTTFHVAGVFDGTDVILYLDGAAVASAPLGTGPRNTDTLPITIGADSDVGARERVFEGTIDEVALYDYALLDTQIQAHFDAANAQPSGGFAYDANTPFDYEALLVLSEIDPALHADPVNFDLRYYEPTYTLINGQSYPDSGEITVTAGSKVLLRYINAGLLQHSMGSLGVTQEVIAADGSLFPYSYTVASETIGPGVTTDRIASIPGDAGSAGETRYAIYDTSMQLFNNGTEGFGGMLTFLNVAESGTPGGSGPITGPVNLDPNPTDGQVGVTVSATIPGATSAEYRIGNDGALTPMSPGAAADEWTATIPAGLVHGDHTIFVHGSDGTTWGAFNFATLHVDTFGPLTSGITLAPNPSNPIFDTAASGVAVNATGDDTSMGNSNITAAEFFIGTPGADGTGTAMNVNQTAPVASLSGTIDAATMAGLAEGDHTVSVHSMDSFGHWGPYATATLVVDQTGPTTSNVVADPNPNNGSTPYSPTIFAIRVDATLEDPPAPDGTSTIQQAEGFINTIGDDGSGFPLTPSDGLFDETAEDAYVYIPLSTIAALGEGDHNIYVHAQDASGNWGATASVVLVIVPDSPSVSVTGTVVNPNPTDGTAPVTLTATATGTAGVAAAEWFEGADPGEGLATPMVAVDGTFGGLNEELTAVIDVSGWTPGDHTIFVRAADAGNNWSATDSVILTVTEPPVLPELLYFSTLGGGNSNPVPGVASPYDDADVYLWDTTAFSRFLDGSAVGLPGNADIDGLTYDGGLYYVSFNRNGGTNVPGVGVVQDEDVVLYDTENGNWEMYFEGAECQLDTSNSRDIDAIDVVGGVLYFSTVGNVSVDGVAGPYDDADIYAWGAGGCSRVFDARSGAGNLLPSNADIVGLTFVDADTFYLSFNQGNTSVNGLGNVQDEDVVLYDAGVWSIHFDGTAQGLNTSNGQDLDAIDVHVQ